MPQVANDKGIRAFCYKNSVTPIGTISITAAAGASTVCNVTVQLKDAKGVNIASKRLLHWWISDDSGGMGVAATVPSGGIAIVGTDGAVLVEDVTDKYLTCVTSAAGKLVLAITASAKGAYYVCVEQPATGEITVKQLATADYGA